MERKFHPFYSVREIIDNIKIYEVDPAYVNYLIPYAPHLFHNSKKGQTNNRKYIGVVLQVNDTNYFLFRPTIIL